ncbi:MAG: DNA-methyltransferase [Candidatus Helarchaeota archaeon]
MDVSDKYAGKRKKRRYIPGLAALKFKIEKDWEIDEAKALYESAKFKIKVDKIIYEDCIKGMKKLPDNSIDLVIADPPFGINFNGKGTQYNRNSDLVIDGYNEIKDNYEEFTEKWISQIPRILKETASIFIFSGWTNLKDILNALDNTGLTTINHIIWKYQFGVFTRKKFVTSHYHILFAVKNPKKYFFNKIEHYPLDVWEIPRKYKPNEPKNSTKLPEELIFKIIDFCSQPGDLILDPFIGNGTTAVCAKSKFRHFIGFEINENLKPIINKNINSVKIGEHYRPYNTFLPTKEEIFKKYPNLKRIFTKNKAQQK